MITWTTEQLKKLEEYYQEEYDKAEKEIENSSYPPDEELQMEKSQAIVWLLRDMMNEKSWVYKLAHTI
jgi:hypothetical protein